MKTDNSIPYTSPALKETFDKHDPYPDQEVFEEVEQKDVISSPWPQTHKRRETPDEIVFNPFEDGTEDLVAQSAEDLEVPQQEPETEISEPLVEQASFQQIPGRDSYSETAQFFRTLETRVQRAISPSPPSETQQESLKAPIEETLNQIPTQKPLEEPVKSQEDEWSFEQLLPQQPTRVPKAATLALLQNEDQARSSTVPEIDKLLRIVAQDNERLADKPLFWSDFRPVEEDVGAAMEMPPMREAEGKEETVLGSKSLPAAEESSSEREDGRETVVSPLLRNADVEIKLIKRALFSPKAKMPESREPEQLLLSPLAPEVEREILLLRMNPQIRNITAILAENEAFSLPTSPILETEIIEDEPDERQARGRSMLRTSDIIEARLSSIFAAKEIKSTPTPNYLTDDERARTISPLRRNPVSPSTIPEQRNRTLSPLQRNPSATSTSTKRRSRTLSPPSLPHLNPIPTTTSLEREESPLRRNPPFQFPIPSQPLAIPNMPTSFDSASRPHSNVTFNQTLARFQNLAEQSSTGRQASTEVTQRAIAGIFIPGSLREQAVRNLSKSRERLGRGECG